MIPRIYFVIWKPGTPLPKIASGYQLVAWPPQQVLDKLRPGQAVTVTTVTRHNADTLAVNPAGLVNLEAESGKGGPVCRAAVFKKDLGSRPATVMQSYSYINTTQTFTYGEGQSTDFGVEISVTGPDGKFSGGGHTSVSTDDSQGFTPQNGPSNNYFQTYFEIGKYRQLCTNPSTGKSYYNWLIEPYQWNAGTKYDHPRYVPPATHCTPEHKKGDNFTKHTTTAKTIKAGYSIGAISGTAETGYSKTAEIKFVFHEPGVLCGHDNTPPNAPGFLDAGSNIG